MKQKSYLCVLTTSVSRKILRFGIEKPLLYRAVYVNETNACIEVFSVEVCDAKVIDGEEVYRCNEWGASTEPETVSFAEPLRMTNRTTLEPGQLLCITYAPGNLSSKRAQLEVEVYV